jgi:hypothetical protein
MTSVERGLNPWAQVTFLEKGKYRRCTQLIFKPQQEHGDLGSRKRKKKRKTLYICSTCLRLIKIDAVALEIVKAVSNEVGNKT